VGALFAGILKVLSLPRCLTAFLLFSFLLGEPIKVAGYGALMGRCAKGNNVGAARTA